MQLTVNVISRRPKPDVSNVSPRCWRRRNRLFQSVVCFEGCVLPAPRSSEHSISVTRREGPMEKRACFVRQWAVSRALTPGRVLDIETECCPKKQSCRPTQWRPAKLVIDRTMGRPPNQATRGSECKRWGARGVQIWQLEKRAREVQQLCNRAGGSKEKQCDDHIEECDTEFLFGSATSAHLVNSALFPDV